MGMVRSETWVEKDEYLKFMGRGIRERVAGGFHPMAHIAAFPWDRMYVDCMQTLSCRPLDYEAPLSRLSLKRSSGRCPSSGYQQMRGSSSARKTGRCALALASPSSEQTQRTRRTPLWLEWGRETVLRVKSGATSRPLARTLLTEAPRAASVPGMREPLRG